VIFGDLTIITIYSFFLKKVEEKFEPPSTIFSGSWMASKIM